MTNHNKHNLLTISELQTNKDDSVSSLITNCKSSLNFSSSSHNYLNQSQLSANSSSLTTEKTAEPDNVMTEWLTSVDAANFLKIHIGTLRNMTSNGRITYHKLGRLNRYRRDDLVNLLLKNKRGATL